MNIVLVDNLLVEQNGGAVEAVLQPHLGLISLLAVIKARGHQGHLYDPKVALAEGRLALDRSLYRRIAQDVVRRQPDIVGLTSLGCNFICTLKVAEHIRRLEPGIPIFLGGPHATILHREILQRYDAFDVIFRHEAEHSLLAAIEDCSSSALRRIPGISFREGGAVVANEGAPIIENLDDLPIPSYEHYPIAKLNLRWLRVEAGRGCPFMCTFCSTASFFGRKYRLKSASRLCAELDGLNELYGIRSFSLQHDLFTVNRQKVLEFCDAVGSRNYEWKCSARMDCVDAQMLREMAGAGCSEIYFGVETGSPRIQHLAKKRLDLSLFYPTLDAADAVGIRPTVSFITGYPQEEAADQAATLDMIGSCFYRNPAPANVQLHLMTPEPGTELLQEYSDQLAFDGFISDFTFPTIEPDDPAIMASAPDVFMNNHFFHSALPRSRHILVSTLYCALYDLSPPVLCLLLDRFKGRLSRLIDEFCAWAASTSVDQCDKEDLVAFCVERWGAGDELTSLVRYMSALSSMRRPSRRHVIRPTAAGDAGADAWILNPEARVLKAIHDCGDLLERLETRHAERPVLKSDRYPRATSSKSPVITVHHRRGAVPRSVLAEQISASWESLLHIHAPVVLETGGVSVGDFVVVPIENTDRVRNIPLTPLASTLLELFAKPRCIRELEDALGNPVIESLISGFQSLRVIVPAQSRLRRRAIRELAAA